MTPPRGEVLQGTLDLIVLKTLEAMGRCMATASRSVFSRFPRICSSSIRARCIPRCCGWSSAAGSRSKWGVSDNNRKAKYYSLTRAGRKQLTSETENWERMAGVIARLLGGAQGV